MKPLRLRCYLDSLFQATVDRPIMGLTFANLSRLRLAIVYQMPESTLEANGHSLVGKLRDIGLSLLNDVQHPDLAFANLDRLLAKLDRLDVRRPNQAESVSPLSTFTTPQSVP